MLGGSFRVLARGLIPLTVLFILAACGGTARHTAEATRIVHGPGFTLAAPASWRLSTSATAVVARRGSALVSATRFVLVKPYRPALFARAAVELDRVAAGLATQSHGKLTERTTTTVDGRRIRAYRFATPSYESRLGFLLEGRREYELYCQARSGDPDGACALLFSSFSVT
jgi:hypothetical protein